MYCIQNLHYLFWSTICDFLEKIVLKVKIDCNNLKGHSCHLWGLKHYMKSKNSLTTKIPRLWFHKMYFYSQISWTNSYKWTIDDILKHILSNIYRQGQMISHKTTVPNSSYQKDWNDMKIFNLIKIFYSNVFKFNPNNLPSYLWK